MPFSVAVEPAITTNDLTFMLRAALSGAGVAWLNFLLRVGTTL